MNRVPVNVGSLYRVQFVDARHAREAARTLGWSVVMIGARRYVARYKHDTGRTVAVYLGAAPAQAWAMLFAMLGFVVGV